MAQNSSSGIIQDSGSSNFKIFFKISWFQETWITLDELYGAILCLYLVVHENPAVLFC